MTARAVRVIVIAVCVGGVAGMIVTTVLHHNGAALTFGLITTVAVLCLMVATAVTSVNPAVGGPAAEPPVDAGAPAGSAEGEAALLEQQVAALVAKGVDEREVRDLVRRAVRLGRTMQSHPASPR